MTVDMVFGDYSLIINLNEKTNTEISSDIDRLIKNIFFTILCKILKAGIRWSFGIFSVVFHELVPERAYLYK